MAMAIPAAEAVEGVAGGVAGKAGGSVGKKAAAAPRKKAPANPNKMAAQANTEINAGGGVAKTKANPTGDPLAISENVPKRDKGGGDAEARARNREARAAESHANRQADRAAKQAPAPQVKGRRLKGAVSWAWSGNRKLLTAQFIACVVVLGAGTLLAPQGSKDGMPRAMVKFSALSGLFLLLALIASGGKGAAKASTALGTLITASYIFTSSDVHNVATWVASFFSKAGDVTAKNPTGADTSAPSQGTNNADGTYTSTTGFTY